MKYLGIVAFQFLPHYQQLCMGLNDLTLFSTCFMILEDVRGIPEFWLTSMKNVEHIADMIQVSAW